MRRIEQQVQRRSDYGRHAGSGHYGGPVPANYYGALIDDEPVGVGNDTIFGGNGASLYTLSNGDNELYAGSGNDAIQGGLGKNIIMTGAGDDTVWGGGGNNWIDAESGNDLIVARGGNNQIFAGSGNTTIYGGLTSNWADSTPDAVNFIQGGTGNALLFGSGGKDVICKACRAARQRKHRGRKEAERQAVFAALLPLASPPARALARVVAR